MSYNDSGESRIPIIGLRDCLLVAIQGAPTDQTVRMLKSDVGHEICRVSPRALVLDVSGVEIMDSYMSRTLCDIAMEARLMGVETLVCGLSAPIAMTLVEMGMDLHGVSTALDLDSALTILEAQGKKTKMTERELIDQLLRDCQEDGAAKTTDPDSCLAGDEKLDVPSSAGAGG